MSTQPPHQVDAGEDGACTGAARAPASSFSSPTVNARYRVRWLRERIDAALAIGRWESTSTERFLRMLAGALEEPVPPACTCPNPGAGEFNRNCPWHGVAVDEDPRSAPDAPMAAAEETSAEQRIRRLRAAIADICGLGARRGEADAASKPSVSDPDKATLIQRLERLIRASETPTDRESAGAKREGGHRQ